MTPFDSPPPTFMVASQVPTSFLRTSCSGPGLGKSWAEDAEAVRARAAAQNQRRVVMEEAPGEEGPRPGRRAATATDTTHPGRPDRHAGAENRGGCPPRLVGL